ncbi:RBBP9/YdeN family alpha/beta hydrolase [Nocardia sp. CDC160]|uniref:RBBP9/YdeN family alpha/beta hydrolase n=1 Tax=Nocardia sp. CDC160 TaxID=3112166 RepID=UPI002DB63417|nr:alpha/beta fold hydrolase [Nocardia sp. CDC160]MEC3914390.1 alpha/beta fold hydrolase [Nocardia sp. CDC160]
MSTIVVSHGYAMTPGDHWYPYLRAELPGDDVRVPALPEPANPIAADWLSALQKAVLEAPPADTVLVGHSLGGVNVLRLLESHDTEASGPFAGVVLVASMAGEVGYDALAPFFAGGFDWPRIRRSAKTFRILHAADDPVTAAATPDHIMKFVTELGATATVTPSGGHFPRTGETATELPEALRLIRETLGR